MRLRYAVAALALFVIAAHPVGMRRAPSRAVSRIASARVPLPVRYGTAVSFTNGAVMADDANTTTHAVVTAGRTNVATYSNSVGSTGWGGINSSRSGNAAVAPDSTTTASSYDATNSTNNFTSQGPWVPLISTPYTFSVYAKSASGTQHFRIYADGGWGTCGALNDQAATTTWQRFTFSCTTASTGNQGYFYILTGTNYGVAALTATLYLWGYQVEPNNPGPATALIATTSAAKTVEAITDSKGVTWAQTGYPVVTTAGAAVSTTRYRTAPTVSDYYTTSSGATDFTGDFSACVVFSKNTASASALVGDWSSTAGWKVEPQANGTLKFTTQNGATPYTVSTANAYVTGYALNVACWGRAGNTMLVKLNGGTTATYAAAAKAPAATSTNAWLGQGGVDGNIVEFWASTTTPSDALFTAKFTTFFGVPAGVTFARAYDATYLGADGLLYRVPADAPRVAAQGAYVEGAATNIMPWSSVINPDGTHIWGQTGTGGASPNAATAPDGTNTATLVLAGGAANQHLHTVVAPAGVGRRYVYSFWLRGSAGGEKVKLFGDGDTWPCDSGAITLTAAWVRYSTACTSASTNTRTLYVLAGTGYGLGTPGNYYAWGPQVEETTTDAPTSYAATTSASPVTRPADALSVAWPALDGGEWTAVATFQPAAWVGSGLFGAGTYQAAASFTAAANASGALVYSAWDGTAASRTTTSGALGYTANSSHRIGLTYDGGVATLYGDGARLSTSVSGAGSGVLGAAPAALRFGADPSGAGANGYVSNIRLCEGVSASGECPASP